MLNKIDFLKALISILFCKDVEILQTMLYCLKYIIKQNMGKKIEFKKKIDLDERLIQQQHSSSII